LGNPIHPSFLAAIQKIELKNHLIQVRLEKKSINENSKATWMLLAPKKLTANNVIIEGILDSLKNIRVKKIFEKDQLNLSNYSLQDPLVSLILSDSLNHVLTLSIGMVNPIDNSAYMMVSDSNKIFQTEILSSSIENLGLADFIESYIISLASEDIVEINIFQNKNKLMQLSKTGDSWVNQNDVLLANEKVDDYLAKLFSLKSQMILDEVAPSALGTIKKYMQSPSYLLEIRDKHDNKKTYEFSSVIDQDIAELKLSKDKHVVVKASDQEKPHIIDKTYIDLFTIKDKELTTRSLY
jgi:hypothetical protein